MANKVQAFQCDDGTLHLTQEAATEHEFRVELINSFCGVVSLDDRQYNQLADAALRVFGKHGMDICRTSKAVTEKVCGYLRTKDKIIAIKHYREVMQCGLKEAKEAVDKIGFDAGFLKRHYDAAVGVTHYIFMDERV